ncbi:MAG TPA: helix-turn-helix transcriptional regulator [Thermoanaerobaculia bacterium]|nr:helix-turn-helix transcriptional regulator [Thermoanaerobaculia bacterium]
MPSSRTQQVELVGRKIRQLRKERKLTQNDLAQRVGIQQSDLSRIERGEYRVSLDILFRMLAEFRVSVTEFFEESRAGSVGPREVLIMQQLNSLPGADQDEIRHLIASRARPRQGMGESSRSVPRFPGERG